jgi:hypothetical protein
MREVMSGGRRRQPAAAKRRFPARRLHLVDIENLAGDTLFRAWARSARCRAFIPSASPSAAWIR